MSRKQRGLHRELKSRLVGLLGGKCVRCGYKNCLAALEFHHRDPKTKSFSLGSVSCNTPWEKLVKEAAKCILLCANCHREHHAKG